MASREFRIQMSSHIRHDSLSVYQIETFDINNINATKIKQIRGAIDCFKIIHSSLKNYFDGQVHMYKPISVQLRILFCDTSRGKDHSLIFRIHPNIKLLAFKEMNFDNQSRPLRFAAAPYSIIEHQNGVTDAKLDISPPFKYISLDKWRTQIIDLEPVINVNDVVRSVADQDGGAHIDDNDSEKLKIMRRHNPTKVGSNVLFIIALSHYVIDFANQIVPFYNCLPNGEAYEAELLFT